VVEASLSSSLRKKEDRDLIFKSGPYFMGAPGIYLNIWIPDFNCENDISSELLVWVHLPLFLLHYWNEETLRAIGNSLGKYIGKAEPKYGLQACARICVEVYLEKCLPEVIKLKLDNWTYLQEVDYEKFPFKCKLCHEYGKFSKICLKSPLKLEINGNNLKGRSRIPREHISLKNILL
jgi:hypothetical protein